MDRRNMSKGRRRRGGIFIVNVKRARRVTRLRLIPTPPPNHSRNHSHFLQAASHSTDIKIQLLLEKREYLRCLTYLERAEVGRFPSRRGRMLRGFCFSSTTFFFFVFSISFFSRTETIASCDSSLLIFPTNFVPHISFVFVSRVNSSLR